MRFQVSSLDYNPTARHVASHVNVPALFGEMSFYQFFIADSSWYATFERAPSDNNLIKHLPQYLVEFDLAEGLFAHGTGFLAKAFPLVNAPLAEYLITFAARVWIKDDGYANVTPEVLWDLTSLILCFVHCIFDYRVLRP